MGTAASITVVGLHQVRVVAPALDLMLKTLTAAVTLGVAALGWARYRQGGGPTVVFQSAAFVVLAIANGLTVALVTSGLDARGGMTLANRGQAPLYVSALAGVFAAALLVWGGLASRRSRRVDHAAVIVLAAAVAMLLLIAVVEAEAARLPSLGSAGLSALPAPTPLGAAIHVLGAALFLWASALSRRLWRRDRSLAEGYLSIGLVFAAFAQIQEAMYPGTYTGLVTSGELLRLIFDVILLLGIQAEAGAILARLGQANEHLKRLHAVEVEHAGLEERARLSRELHDGLAQNLWLAKLKTGRLAALPDLGPEAQALTDELSDAIDAGLDEARQAVAAIRLSGEPTGTLRALLARSVDEFEDRFGLRVEFECEQSLPSLGTRAQAETLRIAQEALNNVHRHADATVVRVRVGLEDGHLVLVVGDNGRGFDLETVGHSAYGLASMRERAELIGGELRIDSRPQDGTRISLIVPLPATTAPALGGAR